MDKINLNLGCGDTAPESWFNYDSSLHAQIAQYPFLHSILLKMGIVSKANWPSNVIYLSLNKRFPWNENSVDCVYASHVIEHLNQTTLNNFMMESFRVLKQCGIIRIVVPDLYYHAHKYVSSYSETNSNADEFLRTLHLMIPEEKNRLRRIINFIQGYPCVHKNMYDQAVLRKILRLYGFIDIVSSEYGKSKYINSIKDVEFREEGYEGSIYIEALKPQM